MNGLDTNVACTLTAPASLSPSNATMLMIRVSEAVPAVASRRRAQGPGADGVQVTAAASVRSNWPAQAVLHAYVIASRSGSTMLAVSATTSPIRGCTFDASIESTSGE